MIKLLPRAGMFLLLAIALMCLGCPSGSGKSGGTTKTATQQPGQQGAGAANRVTADKPARLALDGIDLGQGQAEIVSRFDQRGPEFRTTESWTADGQAGTVSSQPVDAQRTGSEETVFMAGRMISFTISSDGGEEAYHKLVEALSGKFGAPASEPSAWFLSTEWGSSFESADAAGTVFWEDEEQGETILAYYSAEDGSSYFGLLRPAELMDALIATANAQLEAINGGESAGTPVAGEAGFAGIDPQAELVPFIGLSWLEFDSLTLGMDVEEIRGHYKDLGWMTYTVWTDDDWRGMLGANSRSDNSLPADSCFFGNGQLMGFTRNTDETPEEFDAMLSELDAMFGAGEPLPEPWVLASKLCHVYQEPGDSEAAWWWHDEGTRSVLMAYYDYEGQYSAYLLAQVDNFPVLSAQVEQTWGSGF